MGRSEGAVVSVLGAEVLGACCCVVELGTVAWQEDDFVGVEVGDVVMGEGEGGGCWGTGAGAGAAAGWGAGTGAGAAAGEGAGAGAGAGAAGMEAGAAAGVGAEVVPFFLVPFLDPRGRPGFLVALAGAVAEVEVVGMVAGVGTGAEVLGEVEVGAGAGAGREADGAVVGVEWG